ncbi:hypothetical protein [Flavobacterium lotistagni]|nr:hypothetical protein [Flavobacterium lotistagni]
MKKILYNEKSPQDNLSFSKVMLILSLVGGSILGAILFVEFVLF